VARAIIRYSCNSRAPSTKYKAERARDKLRKALEKANFTRVGAGQVGTAAWELDNAQTPDLAKALKEVFAVIEGLDPGVLDHIWVYSDE
jgi:hypothetical protein